MSIIRRLFSGPVVLAGALSSLLVGGGANLATQPAQATSNPRPGCSPRLALRDAETTIREHLEHLRLWQLNHDDSELDKAMCDYAEAATVIQPIPTTPPTVLPFTGTVTSGLDNIRAGLTTIFCFLGPNAAPPTVISLTESHNQVMITFAAAGTPCSIPDGSDTYSVLLGHIITQTVHDSLECPNGFPVQCLPPSS
jgi:hypothetical protein